jgi:hypothetical protein
MDLNTDLARAKQRWQQWFDGTLKDGPIVSVTAPLGRPREKPLPCAPVTDPRQMRMDIEWRARTARNHIMATWYGGDAVPSWFVNFGPGSVAGYLGGPIDFAARTVWFGEWADNSLCTIESSLRRDPANEYWQATLAMTRRAMEIAQGDFLVSCADLGGELDILASLRGAQNLLLDMVDDPEAVHLCEKRICKLWLDYFHELAAILSAGQRGFTCWLPCCSDRPWYSLQCDLSAMFSPDLFGEFVVPRLLDKTAEMEAAVYHWDGPGELAHLDHLLSVPRIRALEYVSVPADPPNSSLHWLPYYRRIAESGRGVLLRVGNADEIIELSRKMPAERLAFSIHRPSVDEARRFLAEFKR